ncbi:response regulator transcription factor [Rhodobacteraceae bacterium]|nr:response regulator transcription factor [Paracoccaceae bacterium]
MKVLVVEDDQYHARYLLDVLADALPEVSEIVHAADGAAGEAEAEAMCATAVVMDLQMEKRNGIEAARAIWARRPATRILFWSNYSDEAYLRGISRIVPEDSAYGYVLKTASRERLKLALRAVLVEGQIMVDREIHRLQRRTASPRHALDDSEYAVLVDLALGLQDKQIAIRQSLSLRTVQNRLLSLYEKLGVEADPDDPADVTTPRNKRVWALSRAFVTGTLNVATVQSAERDYQRRGRTRR